MIDVTKNGFQTFRVSSSVKQKSISWLRAEVWHNHCSLPRRGWQYLKLNWTTFWTFSTKCYSPDDTRVYSQAVFDLFRGTWPHTNDK